eukprot:EG_transcript_5048
MTEDSCQLDETELRKKLQWEQQQREEVEGQLQEEMKKNLALQEQIQKLQAELASMPAKAPNSPMSPRSPTGCAKPPKYEVSRNVLVIDESGMRLQHLEDLLVRLYGFGFQNAFARQCLEADDDAEIVSFGTAADILKVPSRNVMLSPSIMPSTSPMPASTLELALNPSLSAAPRLIDLLTKQWTRHQDETFTAMKDVADYGDLLLRMCARAKELVAKDPIVVEIQSPLYVMGDLHGSFRDVHFYVQHLVNFGHLEYTPCKLLFLGDYVDRGEASVEVAAIVLALKCLAPDRVFLLRGNHETAECNANIRTYGASSFIAQCYSKFGQELGSRVHLAFNEVFAQMPLIAVVDKTVFCVHGGIPRPNLNETFVGCLDRLRSPDFPRFEHLTVHPDDSAFIQMCKKTAMGLLWSDPAPAEAAVDARGFGANPQRGDEIYSWGKAALEAFMAETGYQYIIRAHEVKQQGLRLCQSGKVITVFTSSGYCGGDNAAGALYIANRKLRMVSCLSQRMEMMQQDRENGYPHLLSMGNGTNTYGQESAKEEAECPECGQSFPIFALQAHKEECFNQWL